MSADLYHIEFERSENISNSSNARIYRVNAVDISTKGARTNVFVLFFWGGEYNTTASEANNNTVACDNITPTKSEYHLHKDRDLVKVFVLFYLCESIDNYPKM